MKISEVSYFQGPFAVALKKPLNLHLAYFIETLHSAYPSAMQKALIPLRIRAFPNFAFLRSGAYGTLTYKFVEYHKIVTIY